MACNDVGERQVQPGTLDIIYSQSTETLVVSISLGLLLFSVVLLKLFSAVWPAHTRQDHNDVAGFILGVVGVSYAVLIGAVAVGVWDKTNSAGKEIVNEASAATDVYRLAEGLSPPLALALRADVLDYLHIVIEREWPAMRAGSVPSDGAVVYNRMVERLAHFSPQSATEQIFLDHVLTDIGQLIDARRARLFASTNGLNPILYRFCFYGSLLVVAFCAFFGLASQRSHLIFMIFLSFSVGLILTVIVTLDRPFMGPASINTETFDTALILLERR